MKFNDCQIKHVLLWIPVWSVLLFIGFELFFRSGVIWNMPILEKFFAQDLRFYHKSAFEIARIKNRDKSVYDKYVVLIGGSATGLRSITGDKDITALLNEKSGKKIGFSRIAGSYGKLVDYEKIVYALAGENVTFIIGLEPYLFNKKNLYYHNSKKAKRTVAKYYYLPPPVDTLSLLKKNGENVSYTEAFITVESLKEIGLIIRKTYVNSVTGKQKKEKKRKKNGKGNRTKIANAKLKKYIKRNIEGRKGYAENNRVNFMLLERIVKHCKEKSAPLLFFELPLSNEMQPSLQKGYGQYYLDINTFTTKHQIPYATFQQAGPWLSEHYVDRHHMRRPARKKFTGLLAAFLANQI